VRSMDSEGIVINTNSARVIRNLVVAVTGAIALSALAAPAQATRPFDCKRVITPAEWRAVLGTSIHLEYNDNRQDCLWSHGRAGTGIEGLITGYRASSKDWHRQYRYEPTETRPLFPCGEDDQTRTRLGSFGSHFAWSVEHAFFDLPGKDPECAPAKTLTTIDRSVYVVYHGRLLMVNSGDSYVEPVSTGASFDQLERLAHKAIRRF
jgi:hypothetical protein